jgi:phosphoribosylglycinamide formyltransferase-1
LLDDADVGPLVVLTLSDRGDAGVLERARARSVDAVHVDPAAFPDRAAFDRAVLEILREREIDLVALAGFMRILGPELVGAFRGRMLNVHPALLPAFPGSQAVADALDWGVKVTGVTVHFVDEEVDHGPVVFQEAIEVLPDDDWDALEARVHEVEHRLLPAAVRALAEGRLAVEGRMVRVLQEAPG